MLRNQILKVHKDLSKFTFRSFATESKINNPTHGSYKVLIIGGGTAGISASSNLIKKLGNREVAIIEPSDRHNYQPLWTFVGAGIKSIEESSRPTSYVIPDGVEWIKDRAVTINPETNSVVLGNGSKVNYEYLVVAPGIELKWNAINGLKEALDKNIACSNYSFTTVEKTFSQLKSLKEGNALFTMPSTPIKCAGAPQKIAYLADSYLRNNNKRDKVNIEYHTGIGKIFAIEKYANSLHNIIKDKGIGFYPNSDLISIDTNKKIATFRNPTTQEEIKKEFSFLHVTPRMGPYEFVKASKVANTDGYVEVDKHTLQHIKYENVFSLGDASNLPTSKTAAAITSQTKALVHNLLSTITQRETSKTEPINKTQFLHYDGYTSCPLLVGNDQLILAEFSGYTGQPLETLPYNQALPSGLSYKITKDFLPLLYWEGLLKGRWNGPEEVRNFFGKFK